MIRSGDFSLRALYAALDAERQARGISWAQATREMNGKTERASVRGLVAHALSPSTVKGTSTRSVMEADGILAMLRWLDRTPESFVPGHSESKQFDERLPDLAPGKVLRFDTRKIYSALDAQRVDRKLTWARVAKEVDLGVSRLTHLSKGGRAAFPEVMRIVRWLARPAADFTRVSDW